MVLPTIFLPFINVSFVLYIGTFLYKSMKKHPFHRPTLDTFLYFPQNRFGFVGLPTA